METKRRRSREDISLANFSKRKKLHVNENVINKSNVGILHLPVELLYEIQLYAKNPSFTVVNKHLHLTFQACPTFIKAKYLLARWHEAYCYGMLKKPDEISPLKKISNRPPMPAIPASDLLQDGNLIELEWNSKFIPVLPISSHSYPLCQNFSRSADHFILDYCIRYKLANIEVLHTVEHIVLTRKEFGNIAQATGLWRHNDGLLHAHEQQISPPNHLRMTELPKRLFQIRKNDEETSFQEYSQGIESNLAKILSSFGKGFGPFPSYESLILLLSIASLHIPSSTSIPSATITFNSFEGMPIAKATYFKSIFLMQILLALGADPTRRSNLALYIAIRCKWNKGLKQLVERDDIECSNWQLALKNIEKWFHARENYLRKGANLWQMHCKKDEEIPVKFEEVNSIITTKKRKLLDRAKLDSKMLKEAVKNDAWECANYIRSKGIIADLKTIKMIESKQSNIKENQMIK